MAIKLTKREYLGEGYVHFFENIETGEVKTTPCTKEEYERMGGADGAQYNPVPEEGWKWTVSCGGTVKVDTPSTLLGDDDYTEIGEKVLLFSKDAKKNVVYKEMEKGEFEAHKIRVEKSLK